MNLALRKQAILLEATVHRERLGSARSQLEAKIEAARHRVYAARWWLLAAAIGSGIIEGRVRGSVRWLPLVRMAWRAMRLLSR